MSITGCGYRNIYSWDCDLNDRHSRIFDLSADLMDLMYLFYKYIENTHTYITYIRHI